MNLKITFFTGCMVAATIAARGQNTSVTDAELLKYVIASDSIKKLTEHFNQASLKITQDPKIPAARQQQLAQAQGDSLKLAQLKATAYEKAYLKKVKEKRAEETNEFRNHYAALINDYLGSDLYTKVTMQLRSDVKLKHKYDSIAATRVRKKH